jgi:hypothetical protein
MAEDESTNDDANEEAAGSTDDSQEQDQEQDKLGDAGQRALSAERAARRRAEKEARTAKAELDKLRTEGQSEQEKALAKARAEGETAAAAKANERVLKAEIRAIAASKLADPEDAIHFLDLREFSVDEDGEVDRKAISKALADLVKEKPYLAADNAGTKRDNGFDGGARKTSTGEEDMNTLLRRAAGRST